MGEPDLSRKSRKLLRIINRKSPRVSTKDMTQETGYPNYTVRDHISPLTDEGFVDHVGEEDVGAPKEAKVYSITDAGKDHAEKVLGELQREAEVEGVDGSEVRELREKVETLERQRDTILDRLDEIEPVVKENKKVIDQATSRSR